MSNFSSQYLLSSDDVQLYQSKVSIGATCADIYFSNRAKLTHAFPSLQGHVLLRNLFTPEEVALIRKETVDTHRRLAEELEAITGDLTTYDKAFSLTENLWQHSDLLRSVVLSKRVATVAAKLLGCRDVRVYHDLTFFKEPAGSQGGYTPFHQDGHYWPLDNPKCLTLWLPLTDCPANMG